MNTIRVPLDQFAYLEFPFEGTPDEAIQEYRRVTNIFKGNSEPGLPEKEYNAWIDRYLSSGTGDTDSYAQMNDEQTRCVQTIKRSINRQKRKHDITPPVIE